ncbi:hypothetical protein [Inquilinus sp. Marseille-Q2685]|uniref:hypothetical protein n=1 Tax=Inquilinus sp. Marseille-Q2685 TaxID=2866581 RepID=UPI001CE469D0|nr:hypothetical protein [Inquilinus sp. Marseille-Q2685]
MMKERADGGPVKYPKWARYKSLQIWHDFLVDFNIIKYTQIGLIASSTVFISFISLIQPAFESESVKRVAHLVLQMSISLAGATIISALAVYSYKNYFTDHQGGARDADYSEILTLVFMGLAALFSLISFIISLLSIEAMLARSG